MRRVKAGSDQIVNVIGSIQHQNQNGDQSSRLIRSFTKPSWLVSVLSDLDERMKMVAFKTNLEDDNADTFARRAEAYYQKRPQLLSLLEDLYHGYLSLADRYCQTRHRHDSFEISAVHLDDCLDGDENADSSDAESSLSYQPPAMQVAPARSKLNDDAIVADLVIKSVDYDILVHELSVMEQHWSEESRKIELQKSLLEVLDSERMILLNENSRLGYKVNALVEENKGLGSEYLFMKRKAGELARCLLKMRDDKRVCVLSRKIEDLQGQIYGLEKRNKEYYEQLVKRDTQAKNHENEQGKKSNKKSKNGGEVSLEDCFYVYEEEEAHVANVVVRRGGENGLYGRGGRRVSKWWDRVKNFDVFMCGPNPKFTCC